MTDDRVAFNHVGQCVTDLERSKRFYCELLGFTFDREINPPDEMSAKLMNLTPPLGMTATYLVRDGLVLELLHYAAPGQTQPYVPRSMNHPPTSTITAPSSRTMTNAIRALIIFMCWRLVIIDYYVTGIARYLLRTNQ